MLGSIEHARDPCATTVRHDRLSIGPVPIVADFQAQEIVARSGGVDIDRRRTRVEPSVGDRFSDDAHDLGSATPERRFGQRLLTAQLDPAIVGQACLDRDEVAEEVRKRATLIGRESEVKDRSAQLPERSLYRRDLCGPQLLVLALCCQRPSLGGKCESVSELAQRLVMQMPRDADAHGLASLLHSLRDGRPLDRNADYVGNRLHEGDVLRGERAVLPGGRAKHPEALPLAGDNDRHGADGVLLGK